MSSTAPKPRRILITAGPTHEPIDAVRFIGNRSSGKMGAALAAEAARRGWHVTLLLGPSAITPEAGLRIERFRTCDDLQTLLREHVAHADILIMAAAVADFRPASPAPGSKIRRTAQGLTLDLEPTPDLLAEVSTAKHPGLRIVGFALEPRDRLLESAREKLHRKKADMVVANPLETMDSDRVEAVLLDRLGRETHTPGMMDKADFSRWLFDEIERRLP